MTGLRARLSRLPLRFRLVAGFSAATFVVLLAAGAFVYGRVEIALDRDLDTELTASLSTIDPLVGADGEVSDRSRAEATGVAWQVLDAEGTVLDRGGPVDDESMLSESRLADAGTTPHAYDLGDFLPASHEPYRVQVIRSSSSPDHYLLVGVRRDHRDEALRELLVQLALAGLGTLLITAFVGERLAHAALRPVERYRRRAAAIAAGDTELRLDVPAQRDDEVTRLGHTFNEMLATLDKSLDRERQFVAEASHELRTPITLLKSRVQLARRRARSAAEHERVLAELELDLDRLARLAGQLLELGAAGDDGGGVADLVRVADRVCRSRSVSYDPEVSAVEVRTSEPAVERILTNLLDNAATHGAPPVRVVVDVPDPAWARLTVTDAGAGMPPELLAVATQRFARADEARARPGAGLGLALVHTLVEHAGGELRLCYGGHHTSYGVRAPVECRHGRETTATVLLPTAGQSGA